ncbi:MAG TPA: transglutaminase family protein [Chitinophagaceae bacterium]|nr:transglutaminase family protein [Chitinophagaceae bacterium]
MNSLIFVIIMADYHIKHITRYTYTSPVMDSANQILLYPIADERQEVKRHELDISENPSVEVFVDYYGNQVGMFTIIKSHNELSICSEIDVRTSEIQLPLDDVSAKEQWENLEMMCEQFPYMDFLTLEVFNASEEIKTEANRIFKKDNTPLTVAKGLTTFVYDVFEYKKGITSVETSIDEVWELKAGVCQDFAHMLLLMLRMTGIPARYVSGYICPKNHDLRGEGATHAWVDAYIPFYGWLGLDPTNNCIVSDRHVRLAVGRNFTDCTPVKGTYKGSAEHTLEVSVRIQNGVVKSAGEEEFATPTFFYQVKNAVEPVNSYRRYLEMQQQQ